MSNKQREIKPLNILIKSISLFNGYINISELNQERPDFIYKRNNQIIGIEHIEIPILPMDGQDFDRYFKSRTTNIYDKWNDINNFNDDEVIKEIENLVNKKLDVYTQSSHRKFLINCAKLLGVIDTDGKRRHNATEYINILKEKYPDCDIKIAFLLDIDYNKEDLPYYKYRDWKNKEFHRMKYLDFPFTYAILDLFGNIKDVHDIYIVWHL